MKKKLNIAVVTGSRAEYGLLYWLIKSLDSNNKINFKLIVTGMHLSKKFGNTINEIKKDGFKIDSKIDLNLKSDSELDIGNSISLGVKKFTKKFINLKLDLLFLLGDRFEIFSAAAAANVTRTPIAHIHGGETTLGSNDEVYRHAITKMSHLHFTSTNAYKKRVIQLGEDPKNVFVVGAPGLENIKKLKLLSKTELEKKIHYKFSKKNLLITYHPTTLDKDKNSTERKFVNLLKALDRLKNTNLIFTKANADTGGAKINLLIDDYIKKNSQKSWSFTSMGQINYLSSLKYMDGVIGNSSSGIIEAPSLKIGTINIGDRQKGRIMSKSIINCSDNINDIIKSINKLYTKRFKKSLSEMKNPYDYGFASKKIINHLFTIDLNNIIKKKFYDL